ncbi:deoxynucleoside monophosphate kinase [Microbacterium phage Mabodamaca]|uniref:Deoxynucleoside monophosphate kinase n=1 Tax=Microbacterium phage Mabodamaca TaxID=3078574 RepID=A0AA96NFI8_9CAUD|nr:deoxynucleoside monophosphate kinase [Microbacterium phage Mabodamaca]
MSTGSLLLGLVGKKRTGKNHTARLLARFGYKEAAFADPLRDLALAINPVVGHTVTGYRRDGEPVVELYHYADALRDYGYEKAKEHFPEFRIFLQRLGTDGVRDVLGAKYGLRELLGDDLWIVLAEKRIEETDEPLVFTDVRFPNEARLIERLGGSTIRIERPGLAPSTDQHPSETAMDGVPTSHTIVNLGTPRALSDTVDKLIGDIA